MTSPVWEKFKDTIAERLQSDHPPYRNVAIVFLGDEESLIEIVEVPNGAPDGILQLIFGDDAVTATFTWTIKTSEATELP